MIVNDQPIVEFIDAFDDLGLQIAHYQLEGGEFMFDCNTVMDIKKYSERRY
jgi:hypothetical protein